MGQTLERMKEGYSKIRNEALAHAFSYMNLIEHWGSGIPRIIDKVKAAGLREPEFIGGEVNFRINIYRGQLTSNAISDVEKVPDAGSKMPDNAKKVLDTDSKVPDSTKKCRMLVQKCRIMNRNKKFISMYCEMVSLQPLRRESF